MVTKIVYHQYKNENRYTDCPDGIASAYIAQKANPEAEVIGSAYQDEASIPKVNPGDRLIIVDFSYPASLLKTWASADVEIVVIDHHKTAWEALQGFTQGVLRFEESKSGAVLTWEYFFDEPVPPIFEYVCDRDLWNWKLPESRAVNEALSHFTSSARLTGGHPFQIFQVLETLTQEELLWLLAPVGKRLLDEKDKQARMIADRHQWRKVLGHDIPAVELKPIEGRMTSVVCELLYKQFPDAPFVACYIPQPDGNQSWSFRSDKNGGNFDVSAIAKQLGGGGHHNSAGATFKPDVSMQVETLFS
jgi:oligoribonuclease NrnB/cAMP/cGMP phosphodiesterase (DHH superfamily)